MPLKRIEVLLGAKAGKLPANTLSMAYSSETGQMSLYVHQNPLRKPTQQWVKNRMGGARKWYVSMFAETKNQLGQVVIDRTDVALTDEDDNVCEYDELREFLIEVHSDLIREATQDGNKLSSVYWFSTPDCSAALHLPSEDILNFIQGTA